MADQALHFSTRKALSVQLGDAAGKEIADLLQQLVDRVEHMERTKVDITPIVRMARPKIHDGQSLRRAA